MLNLSPQRLVDVWHELELAFYKENSYGGDTAEIYVYRLCDSRPGLFMGGGFQTEKECGEEAAQNLFYVLKMFLTKRSKCKVTVNDKEYGDWLLTTPLYYRCHVKVEH